ncbi:MAG: Gfo/Idh/MocA family oxidoreductase, partial [Eubacteriales bacterium]|nr:Gfo/Idh/MocA family oxidoreductase [Eubacteriales bacterium]
MERMKTAIVGCGSISTIYMESLTNGRFRILELVACSDMDEARMRQSAERFGIRALSLDEILADGSIELVINLTTPAAHYPVTKRALLA